MQHAPGERHPGRGPFGQRLEPGLALFLQPIGLGLQGEEGTVARRVVLVGGVVRLAGAADALAGIAIAVAVHQRVHLLVQGSDARVQRLQRLGFLGRRCAAGLAQLAVLDVLVVGEARTDVDPLPAFRQELLRALAQLVGGEALQQGRVQQVGLAVVVAEQVAAQGSAGLLVGLDGDEPGQRVGVRFDLAPGQQLAQMLRALVPGRQSGPGLLLALVIVDRGQHHEAVQADAAFAVQGHQLGRDGGELHAPLDDERRHAEGCGHVLDGLALREQSGEGGELVGRVHRHVEAVLGKARDERLVGRHDEHRHGVVVGDVALLHEQRERGEPPSAGADLVAPARRLDHDEVLQHAAVLDRRGQFRQRHRGRRGTAGLVVLGQHQLVEGNEGARGRLDDGVDLGFGEFHEGLLIGCMAGRRPTMQSGSH